MSSPNALTTANPWLPQPWAWGHVKVGDQKHLVHSPNGPACAFVGRPDPILSHPGAVSFCNQSIRSHTFMLTQSVKEAAAGFCTQPMTHPQLLRATQGKPLRLILGCVIAQNSGKQRIIVNAGVGGQSKLSSDARGPIPRSPDGKEEEKTGRMPIVTAPCHARRLWPV